MSVKKSGIYIALALCTFLIFSSCNGMFKKGAADSLQVQKDKEKMMQEENNLITVDSGGYSMMIPKHLKLATDLNDDASLQYQDIYKELYVIVIDESKTEFIKTFSDLGEYDEKLTPEKNYRIVQTKMMAEKMTVTDGPNVKKLDLHGLDAEVSNFTGKVEGIQSEIFYKLAFVEGTKKMYMIMTWTLAEDRNKNEAEMDDMISSFKLTNN